MRLKKICLALFLMLAAAAPALADVEHGGDIVVGVTGPTKPQATKLAIEADLDEAVLLAPASGLLNGWSAADPGFDALGADEAAEQFWMLASGAQIRLEIVSIAAGLSVLQSGTFAMADAAGERILLGGPALHAHPTWYAQSSVLGSNWQGTLSATFRLVDTGSTNYAMSDEFTMTFAVPEPASLALLALGAAVTGMRRRTA